jgi:hypothetical protein
MNTLNEVLTVHDIYKGQKWSKTPKISHLLQLPTIKPHKLRKLTKPEARVVFFFLSLSLSLSLCLTIRGRLQQREERKQK